MPASVYAGAAVARSAREDPRQTEVLDPLGVGGIPRFAGPDVMPTFPGPMPHHDPDPPLILHLERASIDVVRDVFLRIEEPKKRGAKPQSDRYDSLGQFYDAIADGIDRFADTEFTDPSRVSRGPSSITR